MYFCSFLLLCLCAGVHLSAVLDAFDNANICTDTHVNPPKKLLKVTYNDVDLYPGDELVSTQVVLEPCFDFDGNPDSYYSLILIDPDIPLPLPGQFLHWMKSNIKGADVKSGKTISPYVPPTPAPDQMGISHRYIFLLYEHDEKINFDMDDMLTTTAGRSQFHVDEFAEKHQLGNPKFGNFFYGKLISLPSDLLPAL